MNYFGFISRDPPGGILISNRAPSFETRLVEYIAYTISCMPDLAVGKKPIRGAFQMSEIV